MGVWGFGKEYLLVKKGGCIQSIMEGPLLGTQKLGVVSMVLGGNPQMPSGDLRKGGNVEM